MVEKQTHILLWVSSTQTFKTSYFFSLKNKKGKSHICPFNLLVVLFLSIDTWSFKYPLDPIPWPIIFTNPFLRIAELETYSMWVCTRSAVYLWVSFFFIFIGRMDCCHLQLCNAINLHTPFSPSPNQTGCQDALVNDRKSVTCTKTSAEAYLVHTQLHIIWNFPLTPFQKCFISPLPLLLLLSRALHLKLNRHRTNLSSAVTCHVQGL